MSLTLMGDQVTLCIHNRKRNWAIKIPPERSRDPQLVSTPRQNVSSFTNVNDFSLVLICWGCQKLKQALVFLWNQWCKTKNKDQKAKPANDFRWQETKDHVCIRIWDPHQRPNLQIYIWRVSTRPKYAISSQRRYIRLGPALISNSYGGGKSSA